MDINKAIDKAKNWALGTMVVIIIGVFGFVGATTVENKSKISKWEEKLNGIDEKLDNNYELIKKNNELIIDLLKKG